MWDDIASVKASATALMTALKASVPDTRVAVEDFRDFPSRTGDVRDYPYHVAQAFTTDMTAAAAAINGLGLGYGGDGPESRYCALLHLLTGDTCAGRGGATAVGPWRSSPTSKVIVYLTDAPALDPEPYTGFTGPSVAATAKSGAFRVRPEYLGELPDPTSVTLAGAWSPAVALAEEAAGDGIAIYPIVVGSDPGALADSQSLAEATGGKVFTAETARDVAGAISAAIGDITGEDTTGPAITVSSPAARTYLLHEQLPAEYSCTDTGSDVTSCSGTVPTGSPVDTASVGAKTFDVSAADRAGNDSSASVVYAVAYGIQPLTVQHNPAKPGRVIPVQIRLVDAHGANVSGPDIRVMAVSLAPAGTPPTTNAIRSPGRANRDQLFRYSASLGGYILNLETDGLSTGEYTLQFSASDDPTVHELPIAIR